MSSDIALPRNPQGRLYHLNCGAGDLAPYIFTCGDPARAARIARRFDRIDVKRRNREFVTYTGAYKGIQEYKERKEYKIKETSLT